LFNRFAVCTQSIDPAVSIYEKVPLRIAAHVAPVFGPRGKIHLIDMLVAIGFIITIEIAKANEIATHTDAGLTIDDDDAQG